MAYPNPAGHDSHLSAFQRTLLEEEEKFYSVFPGARQTAQGSDTQAWHYRIIDGEGELHAGSVFQLNNQYAQELPQQFSAQSTLAYAIDHSVLQQQQPPQAQALHSAHVQQDQHMTYAPYVNMQPHPFPPAVTPPHPMPTAPYSDISPYASHHQPSQVMGSLPSSARSEDQYPFHGRQYHDQTQLVYKQPTPPFDVSSPHPDLPAPLSPPLLVPATSSYHDLNAFTSEPEHRIIDRPMPPRRRTRDSSRHRISPPYARPPNHRSGGSRGAPSLPSPHATWSQPGPAVMPPNGEPFVMVNNAAVAASRAAATIAPAPVIITPTAAAASSHGKRNPEKKPALACVFCRGRKIACGPPPKDGDGKTCNQCARRSLRCEYPLESRRGMRKKPSSPGSPSTPQAGSSKASKSTGATSNPKSKSNPEAPSKSATNKKR